MRKGTILPYVLGPMMMQDTIFDFKQSPKGVFLSRNQQGKTKKTNRLKFSKKAKNRRRKNN